MTTFQKHIGRWHKSAHLPYFAKQAARRPPQVTVRAQLASSQVSRRLINVQADDRLTVGVIRQHDPGAGIGEYMRLPVSQFVLVRVPLGSTLSRIGSDLFEIVVAKLELFGIWLQPRVKCTVRNDQGTVDIQSISLVIEGSDLVQKLRLNDRVDFDVHCTITHTAGPRPEIHCYSQIKAVVDAPPFFALVPDGVLSGTASAVIKASLAALQRTFVPSLAEDYAKWATSEAYRQRRIQHAIDSDAELNLR